MENGVVRLVKVDDFEGSKVETPVQPVVQLESATHRSLFESIN